MCGTYFLFIEKTITIVLGFRYDRSSTDFVCVKQLINTGTEWKMRSLYIGFKQAYDSVKREDFVMILLHAWH
jgi:hypothetical protein